MTSAATQLQPWTLVSGAQMRELDRHTIEDLGISGDVLMETAGRAIAELVASEFARSGRPICVVCGTGNNGGDGLVVARHLHQQGVAISAVLLGEPENLRGEAATNYQRAKRVGVEVTSGELDLEHCGVCVDAIFGTGLSRPVAGRALSAIGEIRQARARGTRVVSVDLPSGLCADTGQVLGDAVEADATVTIGLPKLGLQLEPGRARAGEQWVARIGIADSAPGLELDAQLVTEASARAWLPQRPATGHKGTFGHVLLIAGSEGKTGAAALAAIGAGRAGAGLVTLACPASLNEILEVKCTEAMTVPVAETASRSLALAARSTLLALSAERDLVALGPGIGRDPDTQALVQALASELTCPLVLDADGVTAFGKELEILKRRRAPTILTPHPGEAAQLLGCSAAEINTDRVAAARDLAARSGAVVLLKGASTIAVEPASGEVLVNSTGGPLLATGGTGDVLLGVVAGFVAQGVPPLRAAAVAAYVHGMAADRLARSGLGNAGLLAGDLAAEVPHAVEELRSGRASGGEIDRERERAEPGSRFLLPLPGSRGYS